MFHKNPRYFPYIKSYEKKKRDFFYISLAFDHTWKYSIGTDGHLGLRCK